jgi:hypothetical protein
MTGAADILSMRLQEYEGKMLYIARLCRHDVRKEVEEGVYDHGECRRCVPGVFSSTQRRNGCTFRRDLSLSMITKNH